jgi:hypothetical protein
MELGCFLQDSIIRINICPREAVMSEGSNKRSARSSERLRSRSAERDLAMKTGGEEKERSTVTTSGGKDEIHAETRGATLRKEAPEDSKSNSHKLDHSAADYNSESARFSRTLRWLQLCVFIDYFGVSLVVPLLPSYFR